MVVKEDVLRLTVSVHDAEAVQALQPTRDLAERVIKCGIVGGESEVLLEVQALQPTCGLCEGRTSILL